MLDQACSKYDANGKLVSRTNKTGLINQIAKIPYNKDLKTLMVFKIGESFVKVQNRDSLYGRLYAERKALETKLNEEGHYAEQAARKLATTKIGKDTEAYKWYSKGKLPPAHIHSRARRWAVKIFVSHVFEEMYRVHYGKAPAPYYVLDKMGHKDYIGPEVPFTR